MTLERLNQRLAIRIRLNQLYSLQSRSHLMHGAGSDLVAGEIAQLEAELRRREEEA